MLENKHVPRHHVHRTLTVPHACPPDVVAMSGATEFNMALKGNGELWMAGLNNHGQFGDGTTTDSTTFKKVLTGVALPPSGVVCGDSKKEGAEAKKEDAAAAAAAF